MASGFAVPMPLGMPCLLERSKLDVSDPRGHGRALQLTPSWGENGPRRCFMSGAESC